LIKLRKILAAGDQILYEFAFVQPQLGRILQANHENIDLAFHPVFDSPGSG
jgi:hypothetical protein